MRNILILLMALSGATFASEKGANDKSIYFADVKVVSEPSVRMERDVHDIAHAVTEVTVRISMKGCFDKVASFAAQHYAMSQSENHAVIYVSAPTYADPASKAALCEELPYEDRTIRLDGVAADTVTLLNVEQPVHKRLTAPRKNFDETVAE